MTEPLLDAAVLRELSAPRIGRTGSKTSLCRRVLTLFRW